MTTISVYDIEAKKIEQMCSDLNTTEPELIEALLEAIGDNGIDISDYV